jgi:hypothetical protein
MTRLAMSLKSVMSSPSPRERVGRLLAGRPEGDADFDAALR